MNKDYFLEKLKERQPTNLETYSYESLPRTFLSHDHINIVCSTHGQFTQKAYHHLNAGYGCPTCGRLKSDQNRVKTTESFIQRSKKCYGNHLDYSKTVYKGLDEKVTITCPTHGDMEMVARDHFYSRETNKFGCRKCTADEYKESRVAATLERFNQTHGDTYDYSKLVYVNMNEPSEIVCRKHGPFWQTLAGHVEGQRCPKCVREEEKVSLEDFISRARLIFGDKYDYSRVTLAQGTNAKMQIGCPTHGFFTQRLASHLRNNGCRKCFIEEQRKTTDEFIQAARLVHGDKYDYSKVAYTRNKDKVEIVCPTHGSFHQMPNTHVSSRAGCVLCLGSKGESAVEVFLKKNNLSYIREYKIPPYQYRYDFYLPDFKVFIEFHGVQHYHPIDFFGGEEAFQQTRGRDLRKRMLVRKHDSKLIVIPYMRLKNGSLDVALRDKLKRYVNGLI